MHKHGNPEPSVVLKFGDGSTRPLEPGCVPLPPGLKKIYFANCEWNIDLYGVWESWPDSLEVLTLPYRFNQPLTGGGVGLPRGLRVLELGLSFDQPLVGVEWPPLLRSLRFPIRYSQSFEGIRFPSELRKIIYQGRAIRGINRAVWPEGLKILEFSLLFNQALVSPYAERDAPPSRKHTLPAGLKKLDLGNRFNQPLSGSELPDGLELLSLGYAFDFLSSVRWPLGLKELRLECARVGDRVIGEDGTPLPIGLPPNLESLMFGDGFNSPLTVFAFPPTLKMLNVGRAFDHPIGGKYGDAPVLPDGLEELRLGLRFNRSIEKIRLPVGLKRLIMTSDVFGEQNQSLVGVMWPPGLEELTVGKKFNAPMEGIAFPETLRELSFGRAFARPLQGVGLPDGLTRLSLGPHYPACFLQELEWPRSLRSLHVHSSRFICREDLARWIVQRG